MAFKDYPISVDEFFSHDGYSAKHFVEHMKFFLMNRRKHPHIDFALHRYKMQLISTITGKQLTIKPHALGKTRKYATLFDGKKELATVRNDIHPKILLDIIDYYLNNST